MSEFMNLEKVLQLSAGLPLLTNPFVLSRIIALISLSALFQTFLGWWAYFGADNVRSLSCRPWCPESHRCSRFFLSFDRKTTSIWIFGARVRGLIPSVPGLYHFLLTFCRTENADFVASWTNYSWQSQYFFKSSGTSYDMWDLLRFTEASKVLQAVCPLEHLY